MGCLKTDNCCCCFSLRTGGLIMGWLGTVSTILNILANITRSEAFYRMLREKQKIYGHYTPEQDLIANIVGLLVAGLLLYGIYNKRSSFLLPQVILGIIGFIVVLVLVGIGLVGAIVVIASSEEHKSEAGLGTLIVLLIFLPFIALIWHFTAVIYSLYQQIKEENEQHPGVAYHVGAQRDPYKV